MGLHLTLLVLAILLWNGSKLVTNRLPAASRLVMRILGAVLVVVDGFVSTQGLAPWIILALVAIALSDGQISQVLFGDSRRPSQRARPRAQ